MGHEIDSLRLPRESAEKSLDLTLHSPRSTLSRAEVIKRSYSNMDPRVPSTRLSPEEQAPIERFVAPAPNATYHIVEPNKGEPLVRRPFCIAQVSVIPAE